MKLQSIPTRLGLAVALLGLSLAGCGGKTATNQVLVAVSPAGGTLVLSQSFPFTASVTGATDTSVVWTCNYTYTTTTLDSKGVATSTTTKPAACPSDNSWGQITDPTKTTVTYTAPSKLPTITPPPAAGAFITAYTVTLTATANADKKKSGSATITLDSGIRLTLSPTTATLAVGTADTQKFTVSSPNESQLNWFLTQKPSTLPAGSTFTPTPASTPCTTTCGTIDSVTGIYQPPTALPTDPTVYLVVNSKTDTTRYAFSTITLTKLPAGSTITFSAISPDKAPWAGHIQDIYLIGDNLRSSTAVFVNTTQVDASQLTVVPLPAGFCPSGTTCTKNSVVTRLRLNEANLSTSSPGNVNITVTTDASTTPPTTVSLPLQLVQTKPVIVETIPDSIPANTTFDPTVGMLVINGGYYGNGGKNVTVSLNGNTQNALAVLADSTSRHLDLGLPAAAVPSAPGLYPVTVVSNPSTLPAFVPLAASNLAIQPASTSFAAFSTASPPNNIALPANSYPSDIALDSNAGFAAVTEAGTNQVDIFDLTSGTPIKVALGTGLGKTGMTPTGIAIDNQLQTNAADPKQHLAVVANNGDGTLSFIEVPSGRVLATPLDLKGLIQTSPGSTVTPAPYAVGIDPISHLALVAFNDANAGLIVQLDPAASASNCLPGHPPVPGTTYCPISSASIQTGATPQIAFEPRLHLAYVSPGGRGSFSVVDLKQKGTTAQIAPAPGGAVRSNNVVTIVTTTPHGIDPLLGGSVLISGLPNGTNGTSFNGTFQVLPSGVVDSKTFQFSQTAANDTGGSSATMVGVVGASGSAQTFSVTSTAVGLAINAETRTAAYADPNASSGQIGFISSLDQSTSSLTLVQGIPPGPTGAPELGARFVAYQPYYNVAVSFNPQLNQVSFLDPVGLKRIAPAVPTGQVAIPSGTGAPTNVFGALAVDPQRDLVLVANAGSSTTPALGNSLTYFKMTTTTQQAVQISQIVPVKPEYGVPNSDLAQATVSTTSTPVPTGVFRFRILGKGFKGATQVRLDQVAIPSADFTVVTDSSGNSEEIDFNLPSTPTVALGPSQQFPGIFSVDVITPNGNSNVTDFTVVGTVDLTANCGTGTSTPTPQPSAVAIDEQRDIAFVTNPGCSVAVTTGTTTTNVGTISILDINPLNTATYGTVIRTIPVGVAPTGIAIIPRLGIAAVTNQTSGTVSVVDYHVANSPDTVAATPTVMNVQVGTAPSGIAIDQDTGVIIAANTGDNTVSAIDLTVLQEATPGKLTATRVAVDASPLAVAVDPARRIAVVTALQFNGIGQNTFGVLDVIDLSGTVPVKSSTRTVSGLTAIPTGLAFDPAVSPGLFYVTSSLANAVYLFNPDTGQASQVRVGENPTSLAVNPNSSELLTVNSKSNTISIVDTQTFRTRATLGIGSQSQFAAAIHSRTNLAVIADQTNNRVLLLPLPK